MARRRRGFSRARGAVKNNIWTVGFNNETTLAAGSVNVAAVVAASDWSVGGERATMLTMRGWLSISGQNDNVTKSEGQVMGYIAVIDSEVVGAAVPDPFSAATYVASNILWTFGHIFESAVGQVGPPVFLSPRPTRDWDINLKTMRTFRAKEDVVIVIGNGTGDDIRIGMLARALLRKGGN